MNPLQDSKAPPLSRSARYCRFVSRRAGTILLAVLLVLIGSGLLASRLELKTALSELLPSNDPGVIALEKTQKRLGDMTLMLVGIHSPDREANLRYAEVLTDKLRALPPNVLSLATYNIRDLKSFFKDNKWLYASVKDLTDIRDRLRSEITKRKNPLLVDLGDEDEESVESMRQRMSKEDPLGAVSPTASSATTMAPTCGSPPFRPAAFSVSAVGKDFSRLPPVFCRKTIPTPSTPR